jgi:hypothetical protein
MLKSLIYFCKDCRHGLINYIDTKSECRYLKKFTRQGTLRQRITQLCELLPLYQPPSIWFKYLPPPFPPSLCKSTLHTDSVAGRGWWGVLSPVGDHRTILGRSFTLYI